MEQGQNELAGCAVFAAAPASQPVDSEADLVPAALAESHGDYATSDSATGVRSFGFSAFSLQFAQAASSYHGWRINSIPARSSNIVYKTVYTYYYNFRQLLAPILRHVQLSGILSPF